jgi:hypothetical protein
MIIKLPVCIEDKISFINFVVNKSKENIITIHVFNVNYDETIKLIKVPVCNNFEGISYIDIFFPLKMKVINNKIICNNFFQKILFSQNNLAIDFFLVLENHLKKEYGTDFLQKKDFSKFEKHVWDYWNNYNDTIPTNNNLETIKHVWDTVQLYLNFSCYVMYNNPDFTNKTIKDYLKGFNVTKKIINIANSLKLIKLSIYSSNEYSFNEHLTKLYNPIVKLNELKIGYKYFIKSIENNKFFQIEIKDIKNNIIHTDNNQAYIYTNYEWYYYIPNLEFDFDVIFFYLMKLNKIYDDLFEKTNLKIENFHTKKLLEYFLTNGYECSLIYMKKYFEDIYSDFEILKRNNYSDVFFIYITQKYTTREQIIDVLKILVTNYSYPIKQNKLDRNFDQILYYSFYHVDKIFTKDRFYDKQTLDNAINDLIPQKLKNLYYNLTNLYYQINVKDNFQFLITNQKFYNDYLHRVVIRTLFSNNKLLSFNLIKEKLTPIQIDKVINIFKNSILCIDVVNRLTWNNLPKRLNYLNILYENKDIIFFMDKFNKNIFPENYDARLKKIIEYPNEMFRFLRKEKDFIKWLKFLGSNLNNLYYSPISLSSEDILHLGKIIFLLINLNDQNLKNENYLKFVNYCQKHNKLILDNTRINLKIKENFPFLKFNINLGFLAKHLTFNKDNSINLEDDLEKTQELVKIEELLRKVTKKYYKYKIKYNNSKKDNPTELPLSVTSQQVYVDLKKNH